MCPPETIGTGAALQPRSTVLIRLPQRIQRPRRKGAPLPGGAVYVGRPAIPPFQAGPVAAGLFRQRQSYAARMVAEGRLTREQAEAKLRPWLAIAAMAGADLPELELHGNEIWPDTGRPVIHRRFAADIAPAAEWRAALATARDAALKQQGGSANQNALKQRSDSADQNTRDLIRLANALHAPPAMPAGEGGSTHHRSETP